MIHRWDYWNDRLRIVKSLRWQTKRWDVNGPKSMSRNANVTTNDKETKKSVENPVVTRAGRKVRPRKRLDLWAGEVEPSRVALLATIRRPNSFPFRAKSDSKQHLSQKEQLENRSVRNKCQLSSVLTPLMFVHFRSLSLNYRHLIIPLDLSSVKFPFIVLCTSSIFINHSYIIQVNFPACHLFI